MSVNKKGKRKKEKGREEKSEDDPLAEHPAPEIESVADVGQGFSSAISIIFHLTTAQMSSILISYD